MQFLKQLWLSVRSNRIFVAVYMALGTALYAQVQSWLTGGSFNESPQYWLKTAIGAAVLVLAADYHLTLPAPGTNPNANK